MNKQSLPIHPSKLAHSVTSEKWGDWRWQLANRLNTLEDFADFINLTEDETQGLSTPDLFRTDVTPFFAALMDRDDPNCPIRLQVVPTAQEIGDDISTKSDPLSEEEHSPVPGLVHRYPDRVLMLVTTQCASYCRFCTRSRIVGDPKENFGWADVERQLDYISGHTEIRDVLLSGGDALMLPDKLLNKLLTQLNSIPHVEIVRINTRIPVFVPQRITSQLLEILKQHQPMWVNVHVNHPKELAPEVELALNKMADAGIPLGCQSVLMAGINDCPNIILDLVHRLVKNRVRPYYLYQCDLVQGAGHFVTPIAKGIEIMEALRGHTSGYAIPIFVVDAPMGGGKLPLLPNYLISSSDRRIVLRNYEGYISTYEQPTNYQHHDPRNCAHCLDKVGGQKTIGVSALLAGKAVTIKPDNWRAR